MPLLRYCCTVFLEPHEVSWSVRQYGCQVLHAAPHLAMRMMRGVWRCSPGPQMPAGRRAQVRRTGTDPLARPGAAVGLLYTVWEICHKEVLLRLAVNGVAGAGSHDIQTGSLSMRPPLSGPAVQPAHSGESWTAGTRFLRRPHSQGCTGPALGRPWCDGGQL